MIAIMIYDPRAIPSSFTCERQQLFGKTVGLATLRRIGAVGAGVWMTLVQGELDQFLVGPKYGATRWVQLFRISLGTWMGAHDRDRAN